MSGPVISRGDEPVTSEVTADDQPTRLGPYRLIKRLGEGGMGVVHLGLDPRGRAVAIKVLRDHVAHDEQARARLAREVSSLSRVEHEAVAAVLDADVEGSRPYLVTRFIPGLRLDEWVRRHGPLAGPALVTFARGLSAALTALHAAGVVHRDVKPGNVMMPEAGSPVLIDFGIAHLVDEARLTVSGLVMGTPGYLSPELLAGRAVGEATDWWGWAATLAYAATGRPPFGGGGMDAVLQRTMAGKCDLHGLDPRLAPLVAAALDPDPGRRPSRGVVLEGLDAYAAGEDTRHCLTVPAPAATSSYRLPPTAALPPMAVLPPPPPAAPYAGFGGNPRPHAPPITAPAGPVNAAMPVKPVGPAGLGLDGAIPEPPSDPRRGRTMRTGTLAALGLALAALATTLPLAAVLAALGWSALARTADRSMTSLMLRRMERGARGRDLPLTVLFSPVHLVASGFSAVAHALVPLALGVLAVFGAAAIAGRGVGVVPDPTDPLPVAAGLGVALLTGWWGIGGTSLRRGSRSLARGLAPGRVGAGVASAVLVAAAAYLAIRSQATGAQLDWWPLRNNPWVDGLPGWLGLLG